MMMRLHGNFPCCLKRQKDALRPAPGIGLSGKDNLLMGKPPPITELYSREWYSLTVNASRKISLAPMRY